MATLAEYTKAYAVTGSATSWTVSGNELQSGSYTITDENIDDSVIRITTDAGAVNVSDTGIDTNADTIPDTSVLSFSSGSVVGYVNSNNDVVVTDGTNNYLLTNATYSDTSSITLDTTSADYTYCFLAGTRISTPAGTVAVEDLKIGDEVLTVNNTVAKVRFNFTQAKSNNVFAGKKHYPVKISANALADNVPSNDLYVTPDHAIYFPELNIFAEASALINGESIYQLQSMSANFTYYHIICDNQEIILANNTPAETFVDNVTMREFDNYSDYVAMYPHAHDMIELDIARAKSARQLPKELTALLLKRAELLAPVTQAA